MRSGQLLARRDDIGALPTKKIDAPIMEVVVTQGLHSADQQLAIVSVRVHDLVQHLGFESIISIAARRGELVTIRELPLPVRPIES